MIGPLRHSLAALAIGLSTPCADAQEAADTPPGEAAWLGVAVVSLKPGERERLGLERRPGIAVRAVVPESPAAAAGVVAGDILLRVDDQMIFTPRQLGALIRTCRPGREVALLTQRDGEERSARTVLAPRRPRTDTEGGDRAADALLEAFPGLRELLAEQGKPPGLPGFRFSLIQVEEGRLVLEDGERVMTLEQSGEGMRLRVTDLAGRIIYDGPTDPAEALPDKTRAQMELLRGEWDRRLAETPGNGPSPARK